MKFLILGCNGMAGHTISLYLHEKGHKVLGFDRIPSKNIESVSGDAKDLEKVKKIIEKGSFNTVINCIGILNQFAEENKELAVFLNAYFPHFLAKTTENMHTQIIHLSTDCVFSGEKGNYTEQDIPDGKTFYDRTKALGEINDSKNLTLRNSIIGPDMNPDGIGLMNWLLMSRGGIKGYTKSIWTGQTTLQLAKTIEAAAIKKASGLFNAVPNFTISKYELLQLLNKHFKNGNARICPVDGIHADKSLKRTNFSFDYEIPAYEIMVKEMSEWMLAHKHLYPHYGL